MLDRALEEAGIERKKAHGKICTRSRINRRSSVLSVAAAGRGSQGAGICTFCQ
jgi:hypothetical protein